jgi:hypothetical protein
MALAHRMQMERCGPVMIVGVLGSSICSMISALKSTGLGSLQYRPCSFFFFFIVAAGNTAWSETK